MYARSTLLAFCLLLAATKTFGQVAPRPVQFDRDIRPILSDHCFACHGPDEKTREGELRLDTRQGALGDRDGSPVIVAGEPGGSEVFRRIISDDGDEVMPPTESKRPLNEKQKNLIRRWIEQGAKWSQHWSLVRPARPKLPPVSNANWVRQPIDAFILARLDASALQPSPEADKRTLIRRVTLDLIGLPPTPVEVESFVEDQSPQAFSRVVDRLLRSPRFGERMAWPWLDAARYADSNGYQGDRERTMYPWRDWVVDAINRNMPYDQFTVWQLAGDLLPNATEEQKLATAFCRNHMINGEGGRIAEENRVEYVFDQMESMSTIWLGLTMTCCRCHDHKYDPIRQSEYYGLFDFFNQTPINGGGGNPQTPPVIAVASDAQRRQLAALNEQIKSLTARRAGRYRQIGKEQDAWEQAVLSDAGDEWRSLVVTKAAAVHQNLRVQDDGSVLSSGPNPANDAYTLDATSPLKRITALRLDALQHSSMTKGGLSRAESGNFVLTDFRLHVKRRGSETSERIRFASAEATFEQGSHRIGTTYDDDPKTGWAVWEGRVVDKPHAAVFRFADPIELGGGDALEITIRHDSAHKNHNLGFFQLSVSATDKPTLDAGRASLLAAIRTPREKRSESQQKLIVEAFRKSDAESRKLTGEIEKANKQSQSISNAAPKVMVMQDIAKRRPTYVLAKGLYNQRGMEVMATVPAALPPLPAGAPRNRLTLARWLVSPEHPLTARVTVNRMWAQFFGVGLVKTVEDFGVQGERPSHPQLLDWLATEFVESGWDVKHLVRLIVTSNTYRQSSRINEALWERDPSNRLLARGPRFRMPSWMLRDQALFVSGLLTPTFGGPSVKPYQPTGLWADVSFGKKNYVQDHGDALYRRSLYTYWRRILAPSMFFDAASRQVCEVKQFRTNTPLHALATLNDVTYVEAARAMAQRVLAKEEEDAARIAFAFRLLLARPPAAKEVSLLTAAIKRLRSQYGAAPQAAAELLGVGESKRDESIDVVEHAAWTGLCLSVLNLDETLTKE